tara:strand:+ start:366 stop:755 length:390 start_codon:yes stop_codon:yes gene_type:complete
MKQIIAATFVLTLVAMPLAAQEDQDLDMQEGFSLMEEGAKLLFRGFMDEMEPALEGFADMAQELEPALEMIATEMGPALMALMSRLDDVRHYEAPEILSNGDIIIRRSSDAPPYEAEADEINEGAEIEL